MSDERMKVAVVGPSKSGKTCIANFLSGTRDTPTVEYKETSPLRILETVVEGVRTGGKRNVGRGTRITVELWDVGGSSKFQACWPACYQNVDALIFVMNPEVRNQEKELELWFKSFAQPAKIAEKHCLVFCHHSSPPENAVIPQMPPILKNIRVLETSLDFQSDNFKEAFDKLVEGVLNSRREAEEEAALRQQNDAMNGPLLVGSSRGER
jgi:Rab family, other